MLAALTCRRPCCALYSDVSKSAGLEYSNARGVDGAAGDGPPAPPGAPVLAPLEPSLPPPCRLANAATRPSPAAASAAGRVYELGLVSSLSVSAEPGSSPSAGVAMAA